MDRTARVLAIAEAASRHRSRARATSQAQPRRSRDARAVDAIAAALSSSGALARGVSEHAAAATIYAIVNDSVYLRLIDGCGWSTETYAVWLEHVLTTALLKSRRPSRRSALPV